MSQGGQYANQAILERLGICPRWLPVPWKDWRRLQRPLRANRYGKRIGPKRSTCEPGEGWCGRIKYFRHSSSVCIARRVAEGKENALRELVLPPDSIRKYRYPVTLYGHLYYGRCWTLPTVPVRNTLYNSLYMYMQLDTDRQSSVCVTIFYEAQHPLPRAILIITPIKQARGLLFSILSYPFHFRPYER